MEIHKPREKEREITAQEREEYFMKLLEGRKKKGNAETEIKKKQKAPEETEIIYVCRCRKTKLNGALHQQLECLFNLCFNTHPRNLLKKKMKQIEELL
jgi:hypothetical protein